MPADAHAPARPTSVSRFLRLIAGRAGRDDLAAAPRLSARLILCALIAALSCGALVIGTNTSLILQPASPHGVVSLQFAATGSEAAVILDAWRAGPDLLHVAERVLWLDFPYMTAYTLLFALLCGRLAAAHAPGPWRTAGRAGVLAAWLAGLADMSENIAHLRLLDGIGAPPVEAVVRWGCFSASLKWALLAAIALLLLAAALRAGYARIRR